MCLNLEEVTVTSAKDILEMLAKGNLLSIYPRPHAWPEPANIISHLFSLHINSYNPETNSGHIMQQELLKKSQHLHNEDSDERFQ